MTIGDTIQVLRNMGWRYFGYRLWHDFRKRSGLLARAYPMVLPEESPIHLVAWRSARPHFLFEHRGTLAPWPAARDASALAADAARVLRGDVEFFSSTWYTRERLAGWTRHPETGHEFGTDRHWTALESLDPKAGDIKYVWERARFTHLLTVMRHDRCTGEDHSDVVIAEILDFIAKNPPNQGPNYVCSQEISLRIMNWLFLLSFYRHAAALNEERFSLIMRSVRMQLRHVYANINFSRIAVRNNHAITECAMLYIAGLLLPEFPEARRWRRDGLRWLTQEVTYQVYPDGTHLQYSTNYHRVVLQVLSYVIALADRNDERLPAVIYERFGKSIAFLYRCQDAETGKLPNYGANDGALFYPLSCTDYRDYRPQLDAAYYLLTGENLYAETYEDREWFGGAGAIGRSDFSLTPADGLFSFPDGGVYVLRDQGTVTFFKCAAYTRNRPAHADGLHVDIWVDGDNVLFDGGSYKYNTSPEETRYFSGTESHNTIMLGDADQMRKGPRFIWYDWTDEASCTVAEINDEWVIEGRIRAFTSLGKNIYHQRVIRKRKGSAQWSVRDLVTNKPENIILRQLWHTAVEQQRLTMTSTCEEVGKDVFVSDYYGCKEVCRQIEYQTTSMELQTTIHVTRS